METKDQPKIEPAELTPSQSGWSGDEGLAVTVTGQVTKQNSQASMTPISIDRLDTWPRELLAQFEAHDRLLHDYFEFDQRRSDDRNWGKGADYVPMALRPENPHHEQREGFFQRVEENFSAKLTL